MKIHQASRGNHSRARTSRERSLHWTNSRAKRCSPEGSTLALHHWVSWESQSRDAEAGGRPLRRAFPRAGSLLEGRSEPGARPFLTWREWKKREHSENPPSAEKCDLDEFNPTGTSEECRVQRRPHGSPVFLPPHITTFLCNNSAQTPNLTPLSLSSHSSEKQHPLKRFCYS